MDQIRAAIWVARIMSRMTFVASRNKANPDDTFEASATVLWHLKAIVKTTAIQKIDYPKFIVHGTSVRL